MMINARKKNLPNSAMNVDKNILIKNLTFDFFLFFINYFSSGCFPSLYDCCFYFVNIYLICYTFIVFSSDFILQPKPIAL